MGYQSSYCIFCTKNDDGEFSTLCKYIYPKQSELKLENQGEHATFLDLELTIENNVFVYKFYYKMDKFPYCANALSVEQYSIVNILWFKSFRVTMNS